MRVFLSSVLLCLAIFNSTMPLAQTKDANPRLTADSCDDLSEVTPDLHRLCVAYCEPDEVGQESEDADRQFGDQHILASYRKKMQPGDPDMPCVEQACPCWAEQELQTAFPAETRCSDHDGSKRNVVRLRYRDPTSNAVLSSALSEQHLAQFKHVCLFRDRQSEPKKSRTLQVSESDFIGCAVSIRRFADTRELECDEDSGYK